MAAAIIDYREIPDFQILLRRFEESYAAMNYGQAADVADECLTTFPEATYRYFVSQNSAAWVATLNYTNRLDATTDKLDKLFLSHPHLNIVCDNTPGAAEKMVEAREKLIEAGLPSVVFIPQGKSGSVTLGTVFTRGFGLAGISYSLITRRVIPSWARDYARGGACYVTHLYPEPRNVRRLKESGINKVIVHVRDPRQALLSFVYHIERYPADFPKYDNDEYRSLSMTDKIDLAIDEWFYVSLAWIEGWVRASSEMDILFSTFEEFKRSPDDVIERYLDYYGGDRSRFDPSGVFSRNDDTDYHFRRGETDEWRSVFSAAQIERVSGALSDAARKRFGWT